MKEEFEQKVSYVLGLASILLALSFVSPLGGLISGIIGYNTVKKSKDGFAVKAKKLNKIGIIVSAVVLALTVILVGWSIYTGLSSSVFPTY